MNTKNTKLTWILPILLLATPTLEAQGKKGWISTLAPYLTLAKGVAIVAGAYFGYKMIQVGTLKNTLRIEHEQNWLKIPAVPAESPNIIEELTSSYTHRMATLVHYEAQLARYCFNSVLSLAGLHFIKAGLKFFPTPTDTEKEAQ